MSGVKGGELDVEFEVVKILSKYLSVCHARIESNSRLVDALYLDSIGIVEVVMMINEEFSVELPEAEVAEWQIVRDISVSVKCVLGK